MKMNLLINAFTVVLLTGCMQTRYITQQYIKTYVEDHKENQFSTIRTLSIFQGISIENNGYLELTGYKYNNVKKLVIGADKYYAARKKFETDKTIIAKIEFIELSITQCKSILENYKILEERVKKEHPKKNEEVYHDFTVSDDLFISYRKTTGYSSASKIDFWIKGEKFSVSPYSIMENLEKFLNY